MPSLALDGASADQHGTPRTQRLRSNFQPPHVPFIPLGVASPSTLPLLLAAAVPSFDKMIGSVGVRLKALECDLIPLHDDVARAKCFRTNSNSVSAVVMHRDHAIRVKINLKDKWSRFIEAECKPASHVTASRP